MRSLTDDLQASIAARATQAGARTGERKQGTCRAEGLAAADWPWSREGHSRKPMGRRGVFAMNSYRQTGLLLRRILIVTFHCL